MASLTRAGKARLAADRRVAEKADKAARAAAKAALYPPAIKGPPRAPLSNLGQHAVDPARVHARAKAAATRVNARRDQAGTRARTAEKAKRSAAIRARTPGVRRAQTPAARGRQAATGMKGTAGIRRAVRSEDRRERKATPEAKSRQRLLNREMRTLAKTQGKQAGLFSGKTGPQSRAVPAKVAQVKPALPPAPAAKAPAKATKEAKPAKPAKAASKTAAKAEKAAPAKKATKYAKDTPAKKGTKYPVKKAAGGKPAGGAKGVKMGSKSATGGKGSKPKGRAKGKRAGAKRGGRGSSGGGSN